MNLHTSIEVGMLPKCDFCDKLAAYDAKTRSGPWANMCHEHYAKHGIGLGLGKGQKFILVKAEDKDTEYHD